MKLLNIFCLFFLSLAIFSSCQKEEIVPEETATLNNELSLPDIPVQAKAGTLYFENSDDFFAALDIMGNMTDEAIDNWEMKVGFTSNRFLVNQLLNEIGESTTTLEKEALVAENSHLIKMSDNEVVPVEDNRNYLMVCNKDNIFYIGNTLNKAYGNYLIGIEGGNPQKLEKAQNQLISSEEEGIFVSSIPETVTMRSCGNSIGGPWATNGNRRVHLQVSVYNTVSWFGQYQVGSSTVKYHARGQKKALWSWHDYNTTIYIHNTSFEIMALNGSPLEYTFTGLAASAYGKDCYLNQTSEPMIVLGNANQPYFIRVSGRAHTTGTGNNVYSSVDCGN